MKNAERLKTLAGGFSFSSHTPKTEKLKSAPVLRRNYVGLLPAKADPVYELKHKAVLTEEQQVRENKAQEEIRKKKALVMPVFNKGGYQLPTESDLQDFKLGLLRRRS